MDNLTEPTAKKRCVTRNENKMQLIECVREFRLPQQFPSTLKQAMKQGIVNSVESPPSILTMPENTITSLSGVKFQIPSKLQKLRILSPSGKDLGEFNVELRTDNPLKGKTITLRSVKKSSLSPVLHSRIFPQILKQGIAKISKSNSIKSCSRSNYEEVNKNNVSQEFTTLRINKIIGKEDIETRNKEAQACNSDINVEIPVSLSETNCKQSLYQTIDSNNQKHIVCNGINNVNSCIKIPKITTEINEITSAARVSPHEEIIESIFPITNLKLAVNSSDNNVHKSKEYFKVSSGKCITSVKNSENVKIVTSLKNAVNFAQHNQINSNLIENSLDSNGKENVNNPKVINNRNKLFQVNSDVVFLNNQAYKTMQKNIMTVIPNNETFLFNQNTISTQEYNTAVSPACEKNIINVHHGKVLCNTKSDNIQSKLILKDGPRNNFSSVVVNNPVQCVQESQPITNTIDTIVQLDVQNKDYPINSTQSDLSDQWNIIKKAMNSVKDNKLRVLALKALADCGIGIERHVPIRLEEHKAVHDTQVQTMIFGLLDTSFIFINKDLDSIQRIKQISLYDMPSNQNQLLTNDLHSNDFLSKAPLISEQENDFDIDSFIKQIFEENSDTAKMKETLSATKIRCKNLIEHLERDFELVKRYDQNGMLNIHNAVISNNIHLVQRQLMILEQCKESVDILTEDGTTSLELAIKYDARSEIVKLLLKAGAQPVIPKYIHESALIIASKRASPLLPMLIDQVSDSKLLDQIDSEGFAALHYCSMRDNLQGVKALLSGGATIDVKDMRSGRTPLFHALDNGHTVVAQTLLKAGAIANVTNYAGQTPLPIV
ncbi:metacaspase-2-like isoform X1 [Cataglyphis hispanica]|uniref:metacaspase-2-like isoform X1 n=1 Tax=Cataglyphis hispanica TaxID=1086592 RepID=UPI00217FE6CD|nr:metacaspase-2-like isoform X1 [Cataglyphis hispanica]XP_050454284.1 metacaspase-2-like isoform X1 [Cataglyphis hispanica]XP_050454285.1 metacaspase-2-like isoform X1 [Cataglyphis hispanica]